MYFSAIICIAAVTTDDEHVDRPKRLRKKRRKKEEDIDEDIIDGFSIRSYKTYPLLVQCKENKSNSLGNEVINNKKEESTETSSANGNAHEESYVSG